jgi:mannosyltransferase OCH1-like enzyme
MLEHYPNDIEMFEDYDFLVQRCDVARCFLLHHFGGIYADMDFECLKSLDPLLTDNAFVIGKMDARIINNGFIASQPGDPVWQGVFADLRRRFKSRKAIKAFSLGLKTLYVMRTTGPAVFNKVLKKNTRKDICIAPQNVLYPKPWIGRKFADSDYGPESIAVHHWEHSWIDKKVDKALMDLVAILPRKALRHNKH